VSSESDQAERAQLQRARELIMNKQFDQARLILLDMPTHPVAQQWLAMLEEIAPTGTGSAGPPPAQPPRVTSASPIRPRPTSEADALPSAQGASHVPPVRDDGRAGIVNITLDVNVMRYVVAGLTAVMAIIT
jgi:hypothetical protein